PPSTSSRLVAARRVHPRPGAPYLRGSGSLPRSVQMGSAPREDGHCPTDAGGRIPPLPEPMSSGIPHAEPRAENDRLRADAAVLREAVRNLSATVAEQRELVWNINSIVLRWDPQGCIIYLNEYGQDFFGYALSELTGRSVVGTIVPRTETSGRDLANLMED